MNQKKLFLIHPTSSPVIPFRPLLLQSIQQFKQCITSRRKDNKKKENKILGEME